MNEERLEHRSHCFGCPLHIVVDNRGGQGEQWLEIASAEVRRLELQFCTYEDESLVSVINRRAGTGEFTQTDQEALGLFQYIDALWQGSNRMYDPSVCHLDVCYEEGAAPRKQKLASMLPLVGWSRVEITDEGVRLPERGMQIDLNACVRPYVVDSVRKLLSKAGAESAFIDLDRDIATLGRQPDGSNWGLGLRYPRGTRTGITRVKLNDGAYAIRGDFERCLNMGGERFGRALSPVDGLPVPGLLGVAVIADDCLTACAAASMARLKTEAQGLEWLKGFGKPWAAIDRQLQCHGPLAPKEGARLL